MEYNPTGNYAALAGFIVLALSYFKIVADQNQVITIIAGATTLYGLIKGWRDHSKLAVAAGLK